MGKKAKAYMLLFPTDVAYRKFIDLANKNKELAKQVSGFNKTIPEVVIEALEVLKEKLEKELKNE